MGDDFNENDAVNLNVGDDTAVPSETISDEVMDKFAEVFGGKSDAEVQADAPADTQTAESSDASRRQRAATAKEQQDELVEEGLVSPDDPDGEGLTPAAEGEETDEQTDEAVAAADETAVEPTLDPNLRFVAQELGWTDEKINAFVAADPEMAADTFQRLADTYTNLSQQMLNPGSPAATPGTQKVEAPLAQVEEPTSQLDKLYSSLSEFAENNGEEIVEKFLKPLKSELIDPVREMMADLKVQKQELQRTEARSVFTEISKKFQDFYGADKALTPLQTQNRATLGQLADQVRTAAKLQGRELSVREALNRAHLIVTADHRERVVRTQIKEQVQKRSKSITAKPTSRRNPVEANAKSHKKAEEAYSRKAAEYGIEVD